MARLGQRGMVILIATRRSGRVVGTLSFDGSVSRPVLLENIATAINRDGGPYVAMIQHPPKEGTG